jgi:hypothetical protein
MKRITNVALRNVYCYLPLGRSNREGGVGRKKNIYAFLVLQPERKRPFWTPIHILEITLKLILDKRVCEDVDWINLAKYNVQWQVLADLGFRRRHLQVV